MNNKKQRWITREQLGLPCGDGGAVWREQVINSRGEWEDELDGVQGRGDARGARMQGGARGQAPHTTMLREGEGEPWGLVNPHLAPVIDVNKAGRLIEGCGKRVHRHHTCGSKNCSYFYDFAHMLLMYLSFFSI